MAEQQVLEVCNLQQSCQQAEEALSQGIDKLQQTLAETVGAGQLIDGSGMPHIRIALENLEALVTFVDQVGIAFSLDHNAFTPNS